MKKATINKYRNVLILAMVSIVVTIGVATYIATTPVEKLFPSEKYQLMLKLNDGEEDAIQYYWTEYILNEDYIFDGPVTFELIAIRYGMDASDGFKLYREYQSGNWDSVKEFTKTLGVPVKEVL